MAIAALALPVAFGDVGGGLVAFWYWALNVDFTFGEVWFNDSPLAMGGALLETLVIGIAILLLVLVVKKSKTPANSLNNLRTLLLVAGILLLISPIGYMIGGVFYDEHFYERYTLFLGIYCAFGAAAMAIISALQSKR